MRLIEGGKMKHRDNFLIRTQDLANKKSCVTEMGYIGWWRHLDPNFCRVGHDGNRYNIYSSLYFQPFVS